MSTNPASVRNPPWTVLPPGWNYQWLAAKGSALAGSGIARIAIVGDSWAAGASSGTVTDALLFGWAGRLNAFLTPVMGSYCEGYTIGNCNPGGANMNSPSSPYGNVTIPNTQAIADGGIGSCWGPSVNNSNWLTISVPVHPVTGVNPQQLDLLTVDVAAAAWQYKLDGGSAVITTPASGSPPTGVNVGNIGAGIMRRTNMTLPGNTTHSVAIQQNAGNALSFSGHITYYGTSGLAFMRAAVPGSKAPDFATGGGTTSSNSGGNSLTPDHIAPWSGLNPSSSPVNNNIYASCASGFPFSGVDLAIIQLGGNDTTQGSSVQGMVNALTRFINVFRRGNPATATSPGCSIIILAEAYVSEYSDNSTAGTNVNTNWQRYKLPLMNLASAYGCAWIDLQGLFGEAPVGRGLMTAGSAHPTQNGQGAGGGDGHLTIAQAIYGIL